MWSASCFSNIRQGREIFERKTMHIGNKISSSSWASRWGRGRILWPRKPQRRKRGTKGRAGHLKEIQNLEDWVFYCLSLNVLTCDHFCDTPRKLESKWHFPRYWHHDQNEQPQAEETQRPWTYLVGLLCKWALQKHLLASPHICYLFPKFYSSWMNSTDEIVLAIFQPVPPKLWKTPVNSEVPFSISFESLNVYKSLNCYRFSYYSLPLTWDTWIFINRNVCLYLHFNKGFLPPVFIAC